MKKKIIAATMAAAMCVSLAACGGSSSSTAASSAAESTASSTAESTASSTADAASAGDEEVDLRMAWWGSQDRHDRTIKAIELYESLHPNVKIEYEYYSFDDYFTKLKTLVASDQCGTFSSWAATSPCTWTRSIRWMTTSLPVLWMFPVSAMPT